ncbi:MAG: transcription elongation factor GreA [Oscillospiraceae bacterium]|nr:transcription elongation factor GreA [Oscillospiraceae bacterium]
MAKEYKLTPERYEELQKELTYLKTDRDKEVTEMIKVARGYGDLSENSEYDDAKNEQAKLYARIAEVEDILSNAVVINAGAADADHIGLGCTFTVLDIDDNEELTFELVGSQEADPLNGRVSDDAPFGIALVGTKVGDIVEVEAPVGSIKYKVLKITR